MKYMPLDISMMKPEPFPYSVMMRPDLHPKSQPSGEEGWRGRLGAVCGAVQTPVSYTHLHEAELLKLAR